jgi:phage major head subunit gpT-like protein
MAIKSTGLSLIGARSEFFNKFDQVRTFPWDRFVMRYTSTTDVERHRWLGALPTMRVFGTGRLAKGLRSESYDVANELYEATVEWSRTEEADDQTGQIRQLISGMATPAGRIHSKLLAELMTSGTFNGYNSYDNVTFFNDAHVSGASGNQDNDLTAAAAAAAKTTAECKTALQASITQLANFKDDQGEPINEEADKIVVVVPPVLYYPMKEAAAAAIVGGSSNILIADNIEVLKFSRLTAGTDFFTFALDDPGQMPFILQEREPLEFKLLEADADSTDAFLREKGMAGVRERFKMTYGFWQKAVRTVFAN